MTVVISSSYVIANSISGGGTINANNPLIGWRNIVVAGVIASTTEQEGFPVENLANPLTHLRWAGELTLADEFVTVPNDDTADLDYIGIARHNFFSAQIAVSIEHESSPGVWTELIAPVIVPNDGPILFRFPKLAYAALRIRMQPGSAAPTMAVVYVGELLVIQRRLYVGHTPINFGRELSLANNRSISGAFLGRIVLGHATRTQASFRNLTPDWVRSYVEPFLRAAEQIPFFFAWRPEAYPYEVGYVWLTEDAKPSNQSPNGMMQFDLAMEGII